MKALKSITFCLLFALLFGCFAASAQTTESKFSISGIVADSASKQVIPYISVSLKNAKKETLKVVLSNADGVFSLTELKKGNYQLTFSGTAHTVKNISIALNEPNTSLNLGTINLISSLNKIKDVTVTANRPLVKQEIDRISYNLQLDPESKSNSVMNMLRKVPYLSVDGSDNILLKGKDDYKIFINGKPSSMLERDPKAILKSMPGSSVERIEVITNPSSKYDGEGIGGIINIVTTKNITNGYNASVNLNERFPTGGPGFGGSLAYKQNKFGLTAIGGASLSDAPTTTNFRSLAGTQSTSELTQNGFGSSDGRNGYAGTELSYEIDTLNFISASVNVNGGVTNSTSGQLSLLMNQSTVQQRYSLNNANKTLGNGWDASFNYQLGFRKNKNQIITFSYRAYAYNNNLKSDQLITNRINYLTPDYKQSNDGHTGEQTVQVDYVHPLKNLNIELGAKAIFRDNDGDFVYSAFDVLTNDYVRDPSRSNLYINDQKIFAAYNTYQFKVKDWGFKAGVRLEQTIIDANFISNATSVNQNYTNILGNIAISKRINDFNSLNFGLMQRVKRAGINKLNPFVDRSNPNFESSGNPDLKPSIMHTITMGYSNFYKLSVNFNIDYNFARGLYIPIATYDPATRISRTTFENVGNANGLSFNAYLNYNITKAWNINTNGNLELISLIANTNGASTRTNVHMYRIFSSTGYKFKKGWRANANVNYVSPSVTTLQGRNNSYVSSGFGLNKDLLGDKLSISANVNNPFSKFRERETISISPDFRQRDLNSEYFRSFSFSMNYKFGKLKEAIKKSKRGIRNDDLSN